MRVERGLQLPASPARARQSTSAAASAASASPRAVVGSDVKRCVDRLLRVDHMREHLDVERERPHTCARRLGRIGGHTAIGWPAYTGSDKRMGFRVVRESSVSAEHGPDASVARAASRLSERTRPCATGERSTAAWSMPGRRTSAVSATRRRGFFPSRARRRAFLRPSGDQFYGFRSRPRPRVPQTPS